MLLLAESGTTGIIFYFVFTLSPEPAVLPPVLPLPLPPLWANTLMPSFVYFYFVHANYYKKQKVPSQIHIKHFV